MVGSRDPDRAELQMWATGTRGTLSLGSPGEAALFCQLGILAVPWIAVRETLRLAEPARLEAKVVIDATNPVVTTSRGKPKLAPDNISGGEQVQRWLPESMIVKAFNTVAHTSMVRPDFLEGPPDMFICGNEPRAKEIVQKLCAELGWPAVDLGGIEEAGFLETLGMLGLRLSRQRGNADHAFKLLSRRGPGRRVGAAPVG